MVYTRPTLCMSSTLIANGASEGFRPSILKVSRWIMDGDAGFEPGTAASVGSPPPLQNCHLRIIYELFRGVAI